MSDFEIYSPGVFCCQLPQLLQGLWLSWIDASFQYILQEAIKMKLINYILPFFLFLFCVCECVGWVGVPGKEHHSVIGFCGQLPGAYQLVFAALPEWEPLLSIYLLRFF